MQWKTQIGRTDCCGKVGENGLLWKVKAGRDQIAVESEDGKQVSMTTICLHFEIPVRNLSYCRPQHRGVRSVTAYGKHSDARNSVALFSFSPCFHSFKLFYSNIVDLVSTLAPPPAPLPKVTIVASRCITCSDHKVSSQEPPKREYLFRKESDLGPNLFSYHSMHNESAVVFSFLLVDLSSDRRE